MEDGSGWFDDPEIEGQERYFDGSEWTSETRAADSDVPALHLPDHVPELQRALAAATHDIDAVESRLGKLFDRAEADAGGAGASPTSRKAAAAAAAAEAAAQAASETESEPVHAAFQDNDPLSDGATADEVAAGEGDDDALAELDEALAAEEPEHLQKERKGLFRRRS